MLIMSEHQPRIAPILFAAGALTLLVTVVRAIGECSQWDAAWFSSEAGSPFNPFGIVWLVPVFGFLFGRRLAQSGGVPRFVTGFYVPMFGFSAMMGAAFVLQEQFQGDQLRTALTYFFYWAPALSLLALFAWPRAFVALLAYGIVARLPVMVVQYLDVQNGWQTHYGRVHPGLGMLSADDRVWLLTLAQAGFWIPFTVTLGCACAAIGALTVRGR